MPAVSAGHGHIVLPDLQRTITAHPAIQLHQVPWPGFCSDRLSYAAQHMHGCR